MLSHVHTQRSESLPKHNDVILVAVVKPFREKMITTLSLMEPCREEFITRHTLDGHIIYADHRISIVTGYLPEEVCGVLGLHYMHKEDLRWAVIGLRQIFFQGSSCGWSCYRIQTKNGKFIYLKTCGYLELTENNDSFHSSASLICINSLVSPVEGEDMIRQMKDQYSPVIKTKSDRNMKIPTSNIQSATQAATGMPPLSIHIKKMGIVSTFIRTPEAVAVSLSPPSSHHSLPSGQCSHSPRTPPAPPPPPTLATPPPTLQNRPSVLRLTHCQGDQVRHGGRCIAKRR